VKVAVYIALSWLVPVLGSCLPLLSLITVYQYNSCHDFLALETIDTALSVCMNVSVAVVAVIYLTVCALCCRIYYEVSQLTIVRPINDVYWRSVELPAPAAAAARE